jgi:hypothetical protein
MALKKVIMTQYGVEAEYHKVILTNVDWLSKKAHCEVAVYLNQQARTENKMFLSSYALDIDETVFDFTCEDNLVSKTYEKLKLLPELEGATDILDDIKEEEI